MEPGQVILPTEELRVTAPQLPKCTLAYCLTGEGEWSCYNSLSMEVSIVMGVPQMDGF